MVDQKVESSCYNKKIYVKGFMEAADEETDEASKSSKEND